MTHVNPKENTSNVRATRMKPPGPGTRYRRETKARTGLDPELRMLRHGSMKEPRGPNKI